MSNANVISGAIIAATEIRCGGREVAHASPGSELHEDVEIMLESARGSDKVALMALRGYIEAAQPDEEVRAALKAWDLVEVAW